MSMSRISFLFLAAPILIGCGTRTLVGRERPPTSPPDAAGASDLIPAATDLAPASGNTDTSVAPEDLGHPRADIPPPMLVDQPFTIPGDLVGKWTGYFQAFKFPSGSDAVALDLIRQAGQPDRITATLGAGPPLDTTGPDTIVPGEVSKERVILPDYFEGFTYTAHQANWSERRLTFTVATREPYDHWCRTLTNYPAGAGLFSCLPGGGGGSSTSGDPPQCFAGEMPFPCSIFFACLGGACDCNAGGCAAATDRTIQFDVTFDPPVSGAASGLATFRLSRASAAPDAGVDQ